MANDFSPVLCFLCDYVVKKYSLRKLRALRASTSGRQVCSGKNASVRFGEPPIPDCDPCCQNPESLKILEATHILSLQNNLSDPDKWLIIFIISSGTT